MKCVKGIRGGDIVSVRICRIQIQRTISYKTLRRCLRASPFYTRKSLTTICMIFPPGAAVHTDSDVNCCVTGRWRFGVGEMVTIRKISRVLGMRLYHNRHIRAVVRDNVRSGVRHGAIGEVWSWVILGVRGKGVAWTLMLLTRMRRRRRLHRHVVRGMVRGGLTGLMRSWNRRVLPIDRNWVSDRAHERGSRRGPTSRGHTMKRYTHRWRRR